VVITEKEEEARGRRRWSCSCAVRAQAMRSEGISRGGCEAPKTVCSAVAKINLNTVYTVGCTVRKLKFENE
jgi:hypothetical protein